MDADGVDQAGKRFVVGQHRAAIAIAAQWLGREERGGCRVHPFERLLAMERAAEALRLVGDELEAVLLRDGGDGGIIRRLAEEVDGDDHARLELAVFFHVVDRRFEACRIDVVGVGQDIDEHRARADQGTTSAVATKVKLGQKTASPGPISQARRGSSSASVPLAQEARALRRRIRLAPSRSRRPPAP